MPRITLKSVSNYILKDVSLSVHDGEVMVLLGPNGAGKSTLLNIVAGLIEYRGSVLFDDQPMDRIGPEKRQVGYLFQDLALFPHMKVRDNVGYGLHMRESGNRLKMAKKIDALLEMVNIQHLGDRYPRILSGGEKQRVALARAIASNPKVLLMDEPLSSLDLRSAKYLRMEFRQLQRKIGATTVFVTHSLDEAAEIADRIAIMDHGEILQIGAPDDVIFNPVDKRIRSFIGEPNILTCQSSHAIENGLAVATCGELPIVTPYEGKPIRKIAIAPEHIYLSTEPPAGPRINRFQGVVQRIQDYSSMVRIVVDVRGQEIVAELPRKVSDLMGLSKGSQVHIILKLRWLQVLNGETVSL